MTHFEYYDDYDRPDYQGDRKSASNWAKTLLDQSFLILDTETTGLDDSAEAIEIAVLMVDPRDVRPIFNKRIKPQESVPREATRIHGISDIALKDCPTFPDIYGELKVLVEGKKVLIYNADFDVRIINQQCHRHDLPSIKIDAQCVMMPYSEFCGNWSDYHQSYTWQRLPGGNHSAIGDCMATLSVIKEMANGMD